MVTGFDPWHGMAGAILIGGAAVLLMLGIGRIAGVCGMVYNLLTGRDTANRPWRAAFLIGMPLGTLLVSAAGLKDFGHITFSASVPAIIAAGLLVGVGTTVGSGCTSGHGVCGLARFSPRSIAASVTFLATAFATVFVIRHLI